MDSVGKKRLLGAVVVFAAAILFLPLLFSGAGVRTLESPTIPPAPELPDLNEVAPATANDAQRLEADISASHGEPTFYPIQPPQVTVDEPVSEVQEQFRIVTPTTKSEAVKSAPPAAKPVVKPEPVAAPVISAEAKKAEESRKTTAAATTLPSAWVVQIASLSNKANAEALVGQLRAKGYRASLSAGNNVWRVVIGPELDRAVAENTRAKILADDSLKMDAIIMPYRP